jgi:hypothetical protein
LQGSVHLELLHFRSILSDEDQQKPEEELCVKAYTDFVTSEEMQLLRKDFSIIDHFLEELKRQHLKDAGWTKFSDKGDSKIYYKQEPGVKSLTLYLEDVIEAPMINLFAILGEVQLFKNWIPMTKQTDIIGEVSHLRKMAYFRMALPWPLK